MGQNDPRTTLTGIPYEFDDDSHVCQMSKLLHQCRSLHLPFGACSLNFPHFQEVADLWLPLSGAEGEGKEGMIHIILSLTPIAPGAPLPQQPRTVPNVAAGGRPMTYTAQPQPGGQGQPQQQPQQPQRPPRLTEEELEEFVKMFPNLDRDIIASVYAASGGDKETMVNNLLQLGQQ